jgi:hypothetical protein
MRTARKLGLCFMALTLPSVLGCQRGPATLLPVTGKVAYRGVPLQGGTIVFTPDSARGESGPLAFGRIGQDGTYHLYTGDALGAAAGRYRVTINSVSASAAVPGQPLSPPYSLLPDQYRDPDHSNLACEIKADRTNTVDFNLP